MHFAESRRLVCVSVQYFYFCQSFIECVPIAVTIAYGHVIEWAYTQRAITLWLLM